MEFKNYNSLRKKLVLPEYGRHIQEMVESLQTIQDRDLRTRQAHVVIAVMGNLNTHLRDTLDFRHKLWDHLFILSEFKLDVDSPYPIPSLEALTYHPARLPYPKGGIRYKQYGKNIRKIIDLIVTSNEPEQRDVLAADIAKFMKIKSYEYNQEYPSNEVIVNDIRKFSNNVLSLDEESLVSTKLIYRIAKQPVKGGANGQNRKRQTGQNTKGKRNNNPAAISGGKPYYKKNNNKPR